MKILAQVLAWSATVLLVQHTVAGFLVGSGSQQRVVKSSARLPVLCSTQEKKDQDEGKKEKVVGIGGADGVVYDVNRLKRNLVQETVREYKRELWQLLGKPSSTLEEIEDKLAMLVQSNPVSTTTDSNLLDGQWYYTFGSKAASSVLFDKDRFVLKKKSERKTKKKKRRRDSGLSSLNPFRSASRLFHLEELGDHEDPYMMDRIGYLGGILTKSKKYAVMGLTRTNLDMDVVEGKVCLFGKRIWRRNYPPNTRNPLDVTILYLDPDLCVATPSYGLDEPFQVYTKDTAWVDATARVKRTVRFSIASVLNADSARKALWSLIVHKPLVEEEVDDDTEVNGNNNKRQDDSKLTVVTLGGLDTNEEDNHAWGGEDDPFVHLSSDERQKTIRSMSFRQLERAKRRKERARNKKRFSFRRIKSFKKPEQASKK